MKFEGMTTEGKRRLMTFSIFSVNILEFEFQPMGFLTYAFLARFVRKSVRTLLSTCELEYVSSKILWLYRKTENVNLFSIIKISSPANFML